MFNLFKKSIYYKRLLKTVNHPKNNPEWGLLFKDVVEEDGTYDQACLFILPECPNKLEIKRFFEFLKRYKDDDLRGYIQYPDFYVKFQTGYVITKMTGHTIMPVDCEKYSSFTL